MSLLLHIETATKICSVALSKNNQLITSIEEKSSEKFIHSERLTILIDRIMKEAKIDLKELSAITINKGPGSFTGLRIGVSVAKGLCYSLKKPLIGIDSLSSLCNGFLNAKRKISENELLLPMIDARRMEVYTGGFSSLGEIIFPTDAVAIDDSFFVKLKNYKKIHVFGDGAKKVVTAFTNQKLIYHPEILCSAEHLIDLASQKYLNGKFENLAYFEPFYLKDFKTH